MNIKSKKNEIFCTVRKRNAVVFVFAFILLLTAHNPLGTQSNKSLPHQVNLVQIDFDSCLSPNNDGIKDHMTLQAWFSGKPKQHLYVFLFVKNDDQFLKLLADSVRFSGAGEANINITWDGADDTNQLVPDGNYEILLYYFNMPSLFNAKGLKPKSAYEKLLKAIEKKESKDHFIGSYTGRVTVSTIPPELSIIIPGDNMETIEEEIETIGTAHDNNNTADLSLTINNQPVPIENGHFSEMLNLVLGENKFIYRLENCAGNITRQTRTITRLEPHYPPEINSFYAEPSSIIEGESATLYWETTHATKVTIDNGIGEVPITGSYKVSPLESGTYNITAEGPGGIATDSVDIEVTIDPPPDRTPGPVPKSIKTSFGIDWFLQNRFINLGTGSLFGSLLVRIWFPPTRMISMAAGCKKMSME
jgi:hypothetical protein